MADPLTTVVALTAIYWAIRLLVAAARARNNPYYVTEADRPHTPVPAEETVSVCVPARDEEGRVGAAVRDLLAQDHPGLIELIVVDDRSGDGTAEEVRAAAEGDARLRLLDGEGPPQGWKGKQAAVWRAQQEATGRWLCFVDADVRLHPGALSVALDQAIRREADMLSWLGQLRTESFWEHVLMPFVGDLIVLFTKPRFVNDPRRDDCLANGQFLLIRRAAYDLVGGHEAVKDSVIDDVSLARAVKFHGEPGSLRYILLLSRGLMDVRMYEDFDGIWAGWTKNFFAAAQKKVSLMLFLVIYLLWMGVLPWLVLPVALAAGALGIAGWAGLAGWSGAAVGLTLVYRVAMRRFIPHPGWAMLLHPVSAAVTAGIVVDSTLRGLGWRKPVLWKGRAV